jgi:hypothetical protein
MPRTYTVRVFERSGYARFGLPGVLIDTLEFESRAALAIFFENGAVLAENRYYQVTATG